MSTPASNALSVSSLGDLLNGTMQVGAIPMQQESAQSELGNNFFNTGAFQLEYGAGPAAQVAATGQWDPALGFQMDPGVQMAVATGQIPLLNNYASKGLGQSGALSNALMQNMYSNYSAYTGNMGNLYNNYQTQLAQLANAGFQANSQNATNQYNAGTTLGQLLASANLSTGSSLAQALLGTGSNMASLNANQGVLGASAYLNTGAAESNNLMQGLALALQMQANQNASAASSGGGGMGGGGFGSSGGSSGGMF